MPGQNEVTIEMMALFLVEKWDVMRRGACVCHVRLTFGFDFMLIVLGFLFLFLESHRIYVWLCVQ